VGNDNPMVLHILLMSLLLQSSLLVLPRKARGDLPKHSDRYWRKYHDGLRVRAANLSGTTRVLLYGCLEWCRKFGREYLCGSYRSAERRALSGIEYAVLCTSGDSTNYQLWGLLHGELPPPRVQPAVVLYTPGPYNLIRLSPLLRASQIGEEDAADGWLRGVRAVVGNLSAHFERSIVAVASILPHAKVGSAEMRVIGRVNRWIEALARSQPRTVAVDCTSALMLQNASAVDCSLIDCAGAHSFIARPKGYARVLLGCVRPRLQELLLPRADRGDALLRGLRSRREFQPRYGDS
jgi:hypothetical protein